ncbi:protein phosphatase 2C domain-containing protein [uncultured Microbacterium sp.]|uniref:PP2C family protein-serine/threonine phosphatase n=1 Tax=uncultured Microbacterium sp. TaxID=191216 RepID=UPI002635205C|nr:protein phosphatase 2C domain-containing protein [uncultured Microbacterium sp.]
MTLHLDTGVASDVGGYRDINQDAAFVAPWGAGVADGVGGGPAGDLASAAFLHRLVSAGGAQVDDGESLVRRIRAANGDLSAHVRRDPALTGMATTFTGVWFTHEGTLLLAHTGDSRAYLVRDHHLIRQTRDDSFVQSLVDQGAVSEEDAMRHPRRNIITASLRGDEGDVVRVTERTGLRGDRWLLCSDGISDYLPDEVIAAILRSVAVPQETADLLIAAALDAGSRDNVTAVVADIVPGERDDDAEPEFAGAAATRFIERFDELAG